MSPAEQVRLVPRWYAAVVVVLLGIFTLVFALTGALADGGVMSRSILGLSLVTGLVLVSACSAFVRRRRPRDPVVTADGSSAPGLRVLAAVLRRRPSASNPALVTEPTKPVTSPSVTPATMSSSSAGTRSRRAPIGTDSLLGR